MATSFKPTKYTKFIAGIVGSVVGLVAATMATYGFGSCETSVVNDIESIDIETCTVMGLSTDQITVGLMMVLGPLFTLLSPKNAEDD